MTTSPTEQQLRCHIADLYVEHALTPLSPGSAPLPPVGQRAVELAYVGGPRGYLRCLHQIGRAIWGPDRDGPECEVLARARAESVALNVRTPSVLDLFDATLDLDGVETARRAVQDVVAARR